MATSAYPHMIFATEAAGLDKDRLVALLDEAAPGGAAEQSSIKLTWVRDGYTYTFWFEDADRVGEMYADYLPEGARRRPLVNATTVVDMSGEGDPEGAHEDEARQVVTHLAAQDGVHVFSERTKRFVGLSYGDEPASDAAAPSAAQAAAAQVPGPVVPMPEPVAEPVATPEPVEVPEPAPVVEPAPAASAVDSLEPQEPVDRPDLPQAPDFLEPRKPVARPEASASPDFLEPKPDSVADHPTGDLGEPGVRVDPPRPEPVEERAAEQGRPEEESLPTGPSPDDRRAETTPAPASERIPGQVGPTTSAPVHETVAEPAAEPSPEHVAAQPQDQPAQPQPQEEKGFFKRLFGRR